VRRLRARFRRPRSRAAWGHRPGSLGTPAGSRLTGVSRSSGERMCKARPHADESPQWCAVRRPSVGNGARRIRNALRLSAHHSPHLFWSDGVPGAANNTGGEACAFSPSPHERSEWWRGWRAIASRVGGVFVTVTAESVPGATPHPSLLRHSASKTRLWLSRPTLPTATRGEGKEVAVLCPHIALTMFSVIFLASPSSIMVLSR